MIRYSIWMDEIRDYFEIVRWSGTKPEIVQTNIHTLMKAIQALQSWRQREEEKGR